MFQIKFHRNVQDNLRNLTIDRWFNIPKENICMMEKKSKINEMIPDDPILNILGNFEIDDSESDINHTDVDLEDELIEFQLHELQA